MYLWLSKSLSFSGYTVVSILNSHNQPTISICLFSLLWLLLLSVFLKARHGIWAAKYLGIRALCHLPWWLETSFVWYVIMLSKEKKCSKGCDWREEIKTESRASRPHSVHGVHGQHWGSATIVSAGLNSGLASLLKPAGCSRGAVV